MKSEVSSMNEFDVRIVKLEPMRVASALGFGATPESDAWNMLRDWAEPLGLLDAPGSRSFGFNNPDPSPGNPNYGYELWLTVTPDVVPAGDIKIKDVLGGLYAVSRFQDLANIGRMWQRLVAWREESNYKAAHHQWLEELLTPAERPPEEYVFDIYLPIRE
jgi:AraC family transcriptional regulator